MTKNSIKYFLLAGSVCCATSTVLTSCSDLDVTPEAQFTAYPDTEEAVEAQMASV